MAIGAIQRDHKERNKERKNKGYLDDIDLGLQIHSLLRFEHKHLQRRNFLSCLTESECAITRKMNSIVKKATITVSKSNLGSKGYIRNIF